MRLLLFIFGLFCPAILWANPDPMDEVEQKISAQKSELESLLQKIEQGQNRLKELKVEQTSLQKRIQETRRETARLSNDDNNTERLFEESQRKLAKARIQLKDTQSRYQEHEKSFYNRIRHVYMNRTQPWIKILLNADSIADFDRRLFYYNRILEADSGQFEALRKEHLEIARGLKEIESHQRNSDLLRKELLIRKTALLERIESDTKALQGFKEEQDQLKSRAEKLAETSEFLKDKIQNLISAKEQIRSDLKNNPRIDAPRPQKIIRNSLRWPVVEKFRIARQFGHMGQGVATVFSPGLDLETESEAHVVAAEDGVIFYRGAPAGNSSTYGKIIMIAHGEYDGRFITLYGNLDNILVAQNQTIKRGDRIGTISRTEKFGKMELPRLHFQVRVNGEPTDPINWLEKLNQ